MNLANKITFFRIILIPVVLVLMYLDTTTHNMGYLIQNKNFNLSWATFLAGLFFMIASFSDFLDGQVARRFNQVTTFGKFFDSIADKLLTNLVLIMFVLGESPIIPFWVVLLFIGRDFIMDVVRQIMSSQNVIIAANKLGKYKAALEMVGMTILFFFNYKTLGLSGINSWQHQLILCPIYISVILSIISLGNYIYLNRKGLLDTSTKQNDKN